MNTFNLGQEYIDLLLEGLRYLEINHPSKHDFSKLLDTIYTQCNQTDLFGVINKPTTARARQGVKQLHDVKQKQDGLEVSLRDGE